MNDGSSDSACAGSARCRRSNASCRPESACLACSRKARTSLSGNGCLARKAFATTVSPARRGVVRAGGDTARLWILALAFGIAQIARDRFRPRDEMRLLRNVGVGHGDAALLVRHHEDVAVGAILRAEPAADAVVLNDDL